MVALELPAVSCSRFARALCCGVPVLLLLVWSFVGTGARGRLCWVVSFGTVGVWVLTSWVGGFRFGE